MSVFGRYSNYQYDCNHVTTTKTMTITKMKLIIFNAVDLENEALDGSLTTLTKLNVLELSPFIIVRLLWMLVLMRQGDLDDRWGFRHSTMVSCMASNNCKQCQRLSQMTNLTEFHKHPRDLSSTNFTVPGKLRSICGLTVKLEDLAASQVAELRQVQTRAITNLSNLVSVEKMILAGDDMFGSWSRWWSPSLSSWPWPW